MADGHGPMAKGGAKLRPPRIAYSGEEYGFGYEATASFVNEGRRRGGFADADGVLDERVDQDLRGHLSSGDKFDWSKEHRLPLRAKEQALLSVKMDQADFAVVPFYSPYFGYDIETLRALDSQFGLFAFRQIEATDKLCLAVYEPQVLDLVQSAHPGSGLTSLLKKERRNWEDYSVRPSVKYPDVHDSGETFRSGLVIDQSGQLMLRDRIDMVFCGPEAARRCKSKLDGLRAAGVEVAETLRSLEPHREMARLARATLNPDRQTNTFFDPRDGKTHFVSTLNAGAQSQKLYGVILPFQIAMMAQDFTIVDDDVEDSAPARTRFFVVKKAVDESLTEDAYRTTDAKTRYWMGRMREVAKAPIEGPAKVWMSGLFIACGVLLALVGVAGVLGWEGIPLFRASAEEVVAADRMALLFGIGLVFAGIIVRALERATDHGVRVMMRFQRDGAAASIGDVENYLKNFGVRHQVVRIDEDSGKDKPAPVMLDIEFEAADFRHDLLSMLGRRVRGSVVNGALKMSFQRWKNRGVSVLAAMPIDLSKSDFQMPKPQRRTWYGTALKGRFAEFAETWFVRLSRIGVLVFIVGVIGYAAFPAQMTGIFVGISTWIGVFISSLT